MEMGIGRLGFENLVFKRKFRFTFRLEDVCDGQAIPENFVRVAARPNLEIEETEINFLNAKTWIPGKASWQTINVSYLDVANYDMLTLFNWLATIYDFTDRVNLHQASQRVDYAATGILQLWDGCGDLLETWTLRDVWPTAINFGELEYASSDISEIDLTLRYSDVTYENNCPGFSPTSCCTPCGT